MKNYIEINVDSLSGPSHFFAGLAYGNLAAMQHEGNLSSPKKAALQGLEKMKVIHELGGFQLILPPAERPDLEMLRQLGFTGRDEDCLKNAFSYAKKVFFACSSSSTMWMANAATVTPAVDSLTHKTQLSIANLSVHFHRSIESAFMINCMRAIFSRTNSTFFEPLPSALSDEGAANHHRFCLDHNQPGLHLFVYGKSCFNNSKSTIERFPMRQAKEASQAIARRHGLKEHQLILAEQHPESVQKGAFHADVIMMGYRYFFICHEKSFMNQKRVLEELKYKIYKTAAFIPIIIECKEKDLSLEEAVASYFFNSQIIENNENQWTLVCPKQCKEYLNVQKMIQRVLHDNNPIHRVIYVDVSQSMFNGGGPACLRLRVPMENKEWFSIPESFKFTTKRYHDLRQCIQHCYPDKLSENDLKSASFLTQSRHALNEISQILGAHGIYSFQKK